MYLKNLIKMFGNGKHQLHVEVLNLQIPIQTSCRSELHVEVLNLNHFVDCKIG